MNQVPAVVAIALNIFHCECSSKTVNTFQNGSMVCHIWSRPALVDQEVVSAPRFGGTRLDPGHHTSR